MRRIKFRAWDNTNKIMDDDVFVDGDGNTYDYASMTYDTPNTEIERCDFPIMQFTGLKDMNGVDIYEGDVISDNISIVGVVEFKNSAYRVNYKKNSYKWFIDYIESEIKTIEVIGNIYENPELLEVK